MQKPTDRTSPRVPHRRSGLAHLLASARHSFNGLRRLFGESAFRQELAMAVGVGCLFALAGLPLYAFLVQSVLFLLLIAVEAINTAIEAIVDRISPEYSEFAKDAKDLVSFAVFALLAANGVSIVWLLTTAS